MWRFDPSAPVDLAGDACQPSTVYLWSELSGAQWIDAWEERFSGNANFVMEYLKGRKAVRLQVYCGSKKEVDAIFGQGGGGLVE